MKKNEKGFGVVEVLLVVVTIGLLGLVGWVFFNGQKDANKNSGDVATVIDKKDTAASQPTDPYAGWKLFCSENGVKTCFKYPDGWTATPNVRSGDVNGSNVAIEDDTLASPDGSTKVIRNTGGFAGGGTVGKKVAVIGNDAGATADYKVLSVIEQTFDDSACFYKNNDSPCKPANYDYSDYTASIYLVSADTANKPFDVYSSSYDRSPTGTASYTPGSSFLNAVSGPNRIEAKSKRTGLMSISASKEFSTSSAARDWLNSTDVKTAKLIIQSVTIE